MPGWCVVTSWYASASAPLPLAIAAGAGEWPNLAEAV